MSDPSAAGTHGPFERRLRVAGALLMFGLLVEGATLFALERPLGFLAFAGAGGLLVVAGIAIFLWTIVSQATPKSD